MTCGQLCHAVNHRLRGLLTVNLGLAHGKTCPIRLGESIHAMHTLNTFDIAREFTVLWRQGQTAGMAQSVLSRLQPVIEGDPLIKHEAFTPPAALTFRHLFEVFELSLIHI